MKLTAIYMKVTEGYIAFIEELPGANTQAATLDEARENLREAVERARSQPSDGRGIDGRYSGDPRSLRASCCVKLLQKIGRAHV